MFQPAKQSLFRNSRKSNYNSGQANYDKPRASPENKGKEYSFIEERRKLVGAVLNNSSQEESKGSKFWWLLIDWDVAASHWLGCCWTKRKIFLRAGVCKVSSKEWYMRESSLFIASYLHFELGFHDLISYHQQVISKLENIHTINSMQQHMNQSELYMTWWRALRSIKLRGGNKVANKLIKKDPMCRIKKQKQKKII